MPRTQIQLPEPLFNQIKRIAAQHDCSLAECVRRGMEAYLQTCPETDAAAEKWVLPVLRGSGGYWRDPASGWLEADAIGARSSGARGYQ